MTVPPTEDTIAAIATAPGAAAIAVVRVSGPDAIAIVDRVFRWPGGRVTTRPTGTFALGVVHDDGAPIDRAVVLVWRAPHSYTREDVVEIQVHGGRQCAQRTLRAVLRNGARPADPGEFTRRAFLNGRIDLVQAEAVLDLILARSSRAATAAFEQLTGGLSTLINGIYSELMELTSGLEASIDFAEEDFDQPESSRTAAQVQELAGRIRNLELTWDEGLVLREGLLAVISGPPNVGKSTLFNALVGSARAIVTHFPGTTRDTIEETVIVGGIPVRLVDTAGLRQTQCPVEAEGIERAGACIRKADLRIHVLDASELAGPEELERLGMMKPDRTMLVANKCDLGRRLIPRAVAGFQCVWCSLLDPEGARAVRDALALRVGDCCSAEPRAVVSERHLRLLGSARAYLEECIEIMQAGAEAGAVPAASCLRSALEQLGGITGRVFSLELLDGIFSRFCVGK